MAAGKEEVLGTDEMARIESAVHVSEEATGLQFLVYLGKSARDTRKHAQRLMKKQGYDHVLGVLVFVSPHRRALEIVTSPHVRDRITDEASQQAVEIMLPAFRRGDWVAGIELGLAALVESAGPKDPNAAQGPDLPNVL